MPTSLMTSTAVGFSFPGWAPPLKASKRSPAWRRRNPSAIWLRQEFSVHTNSTLGLIIVVPRCPYTHLISRAFAKWNAGGGLPTNQLSTIGALPKRREVSSLKAQSDSHQPDQYRHLHERTDDRCKCGPGIDSKYRHRHRDSQLKIVAGSGEGEGRRLGVISSQLPAHIEGNQEHHHEVNQQRQRDPQNVER